MREATGLECPLCPGGHPAPQLRDHGLGCGLASEFNPKASLWAGDIHSDQLGDSRARGARGAPGRLA